MRARVTVRVTVRVRVRRAAPPSSGIERGPLFIPPGIERCRFTSAPPWVGLGLGLGLALGFGLALALGLGIGLGLGLGLGAPPWERPLPASVAAFTWSRLGLG